MKFELVVLSVLFISLSAAKPNVSQIKHIEDEADFDEQVKNADEKLVVVDFFATWCGPCKVISPVLEKLAQQYAANVVVVKVDVDENEELAMRFDVSSMPTFVFLKKGEKIDVFSGANPDKLEKTIVQHIEI